MAINQKEKKPKEKTFMQNLKQDVKDGVKHIFSSPFAPNTAIAVGSDKAKDKK